MAIKIKSKFDVTGMTCVQCEKIIQKTLDTHAGISEATVSYKTNVAEVTYDSEVITLEEVMKLIEKKGYEATLKTEAYPIKKMTPLQISGIGILLVALYLIISNTIGFNAFPEVQASMGYGMLFVVGLLTSIHCISMCGGINLSQCINKPQGKSVTKVVYKASLLYNGGRVISYTIVGAIVGSAGSLVSFTGASKGIVSVLAGLFMILMGINMLGILPTLKQFNIQMPSGLRTLFMGKNGARGPFVVGLLNGLMPCGPLQTMQIYALGTGSAVVGAISMFAFSLGTVPLMFGFGALSTVVSKNFTKKMMKVSAILVIVLGMVMFQRGTSLSGILLFDFQASAFNSKEASNVALVLDDVQTITLEVKSNSYPEFVIQKGIPTKINFHVKAENLNSCNNAILIPEFGIEKTLVAGDNWITFTPTKSGTFPYSCWMGMINSQLTVIE